MPLGAVKPNLTYVLCFRHKRADSTDFSVPRRSEFRMKPDCHLHSRCAIYKCPRSLPCKRCRSNCQDEALLPGGLPQDVWRVFIQVEVAVEVDQIAPT